MFRFRAIDRQGQPITGQLKAADAQSATRELLGQGLTPLELEAAGSRPIDGASAMLRPRKVRRTDLQGLLQELATLVGAGISLSDALPTLASTYTHHPLGPALATADQRLRAGSSLSVALEQPALAWPSYVIALIRAAEASGEMAPALHEAAAQMAHEISIGNELRNALVYPAVLVLAGILAVLFIFVGVVPRFAGMLKNSRGDIPELSRWVIEAGTFLQQHLGGFAMATAGAALALTAILGQPAAREALLQAISRWPIVGPWLRSVEIGRWALVLGALLGSRVPIVDALRLSASTLRLRPMRDGLLRGALLLQQGQPLSDILGSQAWFPEVRLSLIRVGERSGELPRMLRSLGDLETQASRTLQKRVLTLIEPLAILLIGAVIGVIMVAVMMAITSLNTAVV